MSAYRQMNTKMTDKECLIKALESKGYKPEVVDEGRQLVDYVGKVRPERAHIILNRKQVGGASNEVGFEKMANGTYRSTISQYDLGGNFSAKKLEDLAQVYGDLKVKKICRQQGLELTSSTTSGGKKILKYRVVNS